MTVNGNTAAGTFMGFTGSTVGFCGVKSGDSSLYYDDQVVAQGLFAIPDDTTLRFVISPDYFVIYVSNQLFLSEPYSFSIDESGYNVTVGNQTTAPCYVSFTWDGGVGLDWAVGALQVNSVGVVVRGPYSSVRMIVTGVANLEGLGDFWTLSELRFLSPAGSKCVAYDMVLADIDGSEIRQMIYGPNTTQTDPVWENFGGWTCMDIARDIDYFKQPFEYEFQASTANGIIYERGPAFDPFTVDVSNQFGLDPSQLVSVDISNGLTIQ